MKNTHEFAVHLHQNVPPNWYELSIKNNLFQRYWHSRRFSEVEKIIELADSVLDIGCADGTFTKIVFRKTGAKRLIGIDVLQSSINYAKNRFAENKKMKFMIADAHDLPFEREKFDAVFCLEALEHVVDPTKVLQEIYRVLKKDGYAVILVPSENWLFRSVVWPLWQMMPGKNIWKHTHLHNFSNGFLDNLVEKPGFKIEITTQFLLNMLLLVKMRKT